jgi:tRNA(Ile)-lysidine synthase
LQPFGFIDNVVDDLLTALDKHAGRVFESGTHTLVVDRGMLIISLKKTGEAEHVLINEGTHTINYQNYKLTVLHDDSPLIVKDNPLAVSVDADKLVYPLTLRAWQQGDFFYPLG